MAKKKPEIEPEEIPGEKRYSKAALISSALFVRAKDLLQILLQDGETYAISEANEIVNNYLNKEV